MQYHEGLSEVPDDRNEASSHVTTVPCVCATFHVYCVGSGGKANRDLADLNVVVDTLKTIVLKTNVMELHESCRRADGVVRSSWTDVGDFVLGRVPASVGGNVFSRNALRRTAKVFKLQKKYDGLVQQLCSVTSEYGTWHSMAGEGGDDTFSLRALVNKTKNLSRLLVSQLLFF